MPDRPVHPEAALQGIVPAGVRASVGLAGRAAQCLAPARAEGDPATVNSVPGQVIGAAGQRQGNARHGCQRRNRQRQARRQPCVASVPWHCTAIASQRASPLNAPLPEFRSGTVNRPLLTLMLCVCVTPTCAPPLAAS